MMHGSKLIWIPGKFLIGALLLFFSFGKGTGQGSESVLHPFHPPRFLLETQWQGIKYQISFYNNNTLHTSHPAMTRSELALESNDPPAQIGNNFVLFLQSYLSSSSSLFLSLQMKRIRSQAPGAVTVP